MTAAATPVRLIQVPYTIGDDRPGASRGPERLVQAGAVRALADRGVTAEVDRVTRAGAFSDSVSSSRVVNERLAAVVRGAVASGQLPIVLAGSCDAAMGVLGGFDHRDCGVIWVDAHGDFNTPESTLTGFFPGMSLAVVSGHCYANVWSRVGDSTPIRPETTVLLGTRDLDPAEEERLSRFGVAVVRWRDGTPQGDVDAVLDRLRSRVRGVYLHVDMDAFDPQVAPGVVDHPVPGGLSVEDVERIIRGIAKRFRLSAVTIATYDPERDEGDKTLRVALRIVELVAASGAGEARRERRVEAR